MSYYIIYYYACSLFFLEFWKMGLWLAVIYSYVSLYIEVIMTWTFYIHVFQLCFILFCYNFYEWSVKYGKRCDKRNKINYFMSTLLTNSPHTLWNMREKWKERTICCSIMGEMSMSKMTCFTIFRDIVHFFHPLCTRYKSITRSR